MLKLDVNYKMRPEMRHEMWKNFKAQNTKSFNKLSLPVIEKYFDHLVKDLNDRIFTFTFVRHPFESLISAHKNKILGEMIIEKRLMSLNKHWHSKNYCFPAFADQVLSEYQNSSCYRSYYSSCNKNIYKINKHWSPLTSRCSYCELSYDVIGHMETFDEDVRYIVSKAKINTFFPLKNYTKHLNPSTKNKENETASYLRQLSKKQFHDLYEMYKMDFDAFGCDAESGLPQ